VRDILVEIFTGAADVSAETWREAIDKVGKLSVALTDA
jgi:hypothetical protein